MASPETVAAVEMWSSILEAFQPKVPESSYSSWIESLKPDKYEGQTLWVTAPSKFHREFVEEHFAKGIESAILEITGEKIRLRVRENPDAPTTGALRSMPLPTLPAKALPAVTAEVEASGPFAQSINPQYTFEHFIEGDSNSFAKAACVAAADVKRPTPFNPLLIYSGTGLGKTHLLQAIGNQILKRSNGAKVLYVSSEKFTQDFIQAVRTHQAKDFADFYRSIDVLLVDDIQFFATKERTQIEFFHAFNTLFKKGKRIVMTSDRPVNELAGFDQRLISRFDSGLVTNINPPSYETRVAILQDRAAAEKFPLPLAVADLLATHIKSNVRELEGAYITLVAHCQFRQVPATMELAQQIIQQRTGQRGGRPPVERIQEAVAEYFKISVDALRGKSRKQEIAFARMVAMTLMTDLTDCSLKTIGSFFGGRDHSTVIHARDTINEKKLNNDPIVVDALNELERKLSLSTLARE